MSPDNVRKLSKNGTVVFAPQAVADKMHVDTVVANGQTKTWDRWAIEAIPAYNLTRGPGPGKFYHDKGRGNGYVLTYGGKRFYFSGDTEAIPEVEALRNIDVAFVCMNLPFTMTPQEAADAVKKFHPAIVYPYHYRGSDLNAFSAALCGYRHRGTPARGMVPPKAERSGCALLDLSFGYCALLSPRM